MRLGTWNCQPGLSAHWDDVDALRLDVLAVQECGAQTPDQAAARGGWTCEWQSGRWHKGHAVLAREPYLIESREGSEPFVVSTVISGPVRFRFVGFWAMTPKDVGYSYPRQASRLVDALPDDGLPTVVAGDFNASKRPQALGNVQRLRDRGLVSAYHAFHGVEHSAVEAQPTSYFRWQESGAFHMDFVFVPEEWGIEAVEIGTFESYPGRGLSDHVPVVVSVHPGLSH